MVASVAITTEVSALKNKAKELSRQYHIPFVADGANEYRYLLVLTATHLELRNQTTSQKQKPLIIDFNSDQLGYRQRHLSLRNELLARAMGVSGKFKPYIFDCTVGLGRDAFILHLLGCRVLMFERSAIMAALLKDALDRYQADEKDFGLIFANALDYLIKPNWDDRPDVIYLDPMYPERKKSALVKKEMRLLQDMIGADVDAALLLEQALQVALKRVVVKRPLHAESLNQRRPDICFKGKNTRFDVYLIN